MNPGIPYGQFIGGLVGAAFLIFGGVWCLYLWPRAIRRKIDRGEIDAFDGLAKLRKAPLFGYMLILLAIGDLLGTLNQIGFSDDSLLAAVGFFAFAVGVLVWWFVQKKKLNL
jgi:hypothetical protein